MRPDIELFCFMAADEGLITAEQCAVVREAWSGQGSLDEFVEFLEDCGLGEGIRMTELKEQVCGLMSVEDLSFLDSSDEVEDIGRQPWRPSLELEWFCHEAVTGGLLTPELCLCVASNVEGSTGLLSFAQAVVDSRLCDDAMAVQGLVEKALSLAAGGEPPPVAMFAG